MLGPGRRASDPNCAGNTLTREVPQTAEAKISSTSNATLAICPLASGQSQWACDAPVVRPHSFEAGFRVPNRYPKKIMEGDQMEPFVVGAVVKAGQTADKFAEAASKEAGSLLGRLFGPSADVIGHHWAARLKERNLERLLRKTEKHSANIENPGFANPRVAAQVFESASYADDEFVAEYLSGVLASSRNPSGSSDLGLNWSSLVARLPALTLRLHFMLYDAVRRGALHCSVDTVNNIHEEAYVVDLESVTRELGGLDRGVELASLLETLMRENLISTQGYLYGYSDAKEFLPEHQRDKKIFDAPWPSVLRFRPTVHGIQLFMWGLGQGDQPRDAYLDPQIVFDLIEPEHAPKALPSAVLNHICIQDRV